jgi:hypothetical protein
MLPQNPTTRTSRKSLFVMIIVSAVLAIAITPFVQDKVNDIFAPEESSRLGPTDNTHANDFTTVENQTVPDILQQAPATTASEMRANPPGMECSPDGQSCSSSQACDADNNCTINGLPVEED